MTGEHTVSLVGDYDTLALAITAWDGVNLTAQTDYCELIVDPIIASGQKRYHLIQKMLYYYYH